MSKKITELASISTLAGADVFPVVDVSDGNTRKITLTNLINEILGGGVDSLPWADVNKSGSLISDIDQIPQEQRETMEVQSIWEPLSFNSDIEMRPITEDPDGNTINAWQALTVYNLGDYVKATGAPSGRVHECIDPGTTGGGEPVWDNNQGKDTADNDIIWRCRGLNVIETQRDLTGELSPGYALMYNTLHGLTRRYGKILSITSTRIFIAGVSVDNAFDMEFFYYSSYPLIHQLEIYIDGTYADGIDATLLENDMNRFLNWITRIGYVIDIYMKNKTDDSTGNPKININLNGSTILDNDDSKGQEVSSTWGRNGGHPVGINMSNYAMTPNSANRVLEVNCTAAGDTADAADLSIMMSILVPPPLLTLPVMPTN